MNNYKQALDILQTATSTSPQFPEETNFHKWLEEEYKYLASKKATPPMEEWKMEYYQMLVELGSAEYVLSSVLIYIHSIDRECLAAVKHLFINYDPTSKDKTASIETAHRHAPEKRDKLLEQIQALEARYKLVKRWAKDSAEWKEAAGLTSMHLYQKALDRLEGLVVAHLFELTKMNMSRTGMGPFFLTELTQSARL